MEARNLLKKSRKKIVDEAIENERLEGLKVSSDSKKMADKYIVGEISAEEAAEKIRVRYGAL